MTMLKSYKVYHSDRNSADYVEVSETLLRKHISVRINKGEIVILDNEAWHELCGTLYSLQCDPVEEPADGNI